jgi:hypothetical protein
MTEEYVNGCLNNLKLFIWCFLIGLKM